MNKGNIDINFKLKRMKTQITLYLLILMIAVLLLSYLLGYLVGYNSIMEG